MPGGRAAGARLFRALRRGCLQLEIDHPFQHKTTNNAEENILTLGEIPDQVPINAAGDVA